MRTSTIISACLGASATIAAAPPSPSPTTLVKQTRTTNTIATPVTQVKLEGEGVHLWETPEGTFLGQLYVGSNDYPVKLLLDPASRDTWIWTTDYHDPPPHKEDQHRKPEGHEPLYRPDESRTVQRDEAGDGWGSYEEACVNWSEINKGTVSWKGYKDTFKFSGHTHENVSFGGAYTFDGDIDKGDFDGILGLGIDSKFLEAVGAHWNESIFGLQINRTPYIDTTNPEKSTHGSLALGAWAGMPDVAARGLTGPFQYTDQYTIPYIPHAWAVHTTKVEITNLNEEKLKKDIYEGRPVPPKYDSGHDFALVVNFASPMSFLPKEIVEEFVYRAGGIMHDGVRPMVPCKNDGYKDGWRMIGHFTPDIVITVPRSASDTNSTEADSKFTIKGTDLIQGSNTGQPGMCDIALSPAHTEYSVLGSKAMTDTYWTFHKDKKQVGFATKKDPFW